MKTEIIFKVLIKNNKSYLIAIVISTLSIVPLVNHCQMITSDQAGKFLACVDSGKLTSPFNSSVSASGTNIDQQVFTQDISFNDSQPKNYVNVPVYFGTNNA